MRLIIGLLITLISLHAEHIRWYGDYDKALIKAIKEQKPIMVFMVEQDCSDCRKMLTSTLKDQSYIRWVNQHFISVLITQGHEHSYPIEMLYTLTYPALFFLTPDELFLGDPLIGYVSPKEFESYIGSLLKE